MKWYCITLRETPERTAHARAQAEKAGLDVDFIYGFFGATFKIASEIPMHCDGGTPYFIKRGMVALVLSWHMALQIAEREGHEEFVIMEDDFILQDGFLERWKEVRAEFRDDYQLVYLQHCCTEGKPRWQHSKNLVSVHYPLCTGALWFRRGEIFKLFYDLVVPASTPVDILIEWNLLPRIDHRFALVDPPLITQATAAGIMPSSVHL